MKKKNVPSLFLCLSGAAALGIQIIQSSSSINALNLKGMGVLEYLLSPSSSSSPLTSNVIISPDLSVLLPRGGVLYRFGGVLPTYSPTGQRQRRRIEIEISSECNEDNNVVPSWDMLWSDYHGAFGQNITAATIDGSSDKTTLYIPWRSESQVRPLFLVLYNCGNETVVVRYVEENIGQSNIPGRYRQRIREIDSDEVFRYPRRELNFRSRMGNNSGLVTLCTQLTTERLHHLKYIAQAWQGPISAVIYVGFRYKMEVDMQRVIEFWDKGQEEIRHYVDLHLVYDDKRPWYPSGTDETKFLTQNPYPINLLRQISIDAARTEWIYLVEADMISVRNGHGVVSDIWEEMMAVYADKGPGTAFIVPLYAVPSGVNENTLKQLPSSKDVLLGKGKVSTGGSIIHGSMSLLKKSEDIVLEGANLPILSVANDVRRKESIAMDYNAWESQEPKGKNEAPSFIPFHQSGDEGMICRPPAGFGPQEPYFIAKRADMPPYNVLFAGMHWDAVAQINDMCNCGFSFYIHP